ncbi:LOW QUALITY PROTEIN: hypothetical protein U9M48_001686 [Paspalum notatum var. saurae]|uniref:Uncharacterized protein n=1 Tax=Paspalum notatum var. saurae TaxID=547442 RepID=A0AAQ3SJ76_PASNO
MTTPMSTNTALDADEDGEATKGILRDDRLIILKTVPTFVGGASLCALPGLLTVKRGFSNADHGYGLTASQPPHMPTLRNLSCLLVLPQAS